MRWGLVGYYGFGNLGDDLMLAVLARGIRELDPDARISVLCPGGGRPERVPGEAVMGPRAVLPASGWRRRWAAVGQVDALIFGGGTCLHRFGFCDLHASLLARLRGRPVRWLGVGVEDPGSGLRRWKAKLALSLCGGAGFRDQRSAELAGRILPGFARGRVTGDLSYLLESVVETSELWRTPAGPDASTLVVCWRALEGYASFADEARAAEHAAAAVARTARELGLGRVVALSLADEVDGPATRSVARGLERELGGADPGIELVVADRVPLREKLGILAGASLAVSVRLHGWLVARLLGTPAVGVAYAGKVRAMARELERPAVVELDGVVDGPEALVKALAREHEAPSRFRDLEASRARARENFELIADLLRS